MFKLDRTNIMFLIMFVSLVLFAALIILDVGTMWITAVLAWMIVVVLIGLVGYSTEE